MNCAIVSPDVSQYANTVNVPVEKERVEKVESSQTFDCFETKNEKEEEQVYQQCVQKMHVLDEIKRFDVKEFYKKKKNFKENSPDRNSVYEDSMSSSLHSIQLTTCQKEVTVHSSKSEKASGTSIFNMKPDYLIPLQKPGLQKPEDVACGGFSETKTKRRFREEPRPRTDPPKDSVNLYDYNVKSVRCNLSRHDSCDDCQFPDSSHAGNLSEKSSTFTISIRPMKDSPVQVTPCDKMHQPVLKSDQDFYWSDTRSKLIMKDSYHCTDAPDPWNLMTTYWRGAQEEYRPRKDPPALVHHQHLPWLDHHGSTLVMAHG